MSGMAELTTGLVRTLALANPHHQHGTTVPLLVHLYYNIDCSSSVTPVAALNFCVKITCRMLRLTLPEQSRGYNTSC
jgi:hypothetical protein